MVSVAVVVVVLVVVAAVVEVWVVDVAVVEVWVVLPLLSPIFIFNPVLEEAKYKYLTSFLFVMLKTSLLLLSVIIICFPEAIVFL